MKLAHSGDIDIALARPQKISREALKKTALHSEPASLCDAGAREIKGLPPFSRGESSRFLIN